MIEISENLTTVSQVIQQAVAPVFLLTGVGAILSVLAMRLGRVVDRYRVLMERDGHTPQDIEEVRILSRRAVWVQWSITLCTLSALMVAMVIGVLFIGYEREKDPSHIVSPMFIFAMVCLIFGLLFFLREIYLSTHTIALPSTLENDPE
jgi:hypothetical protein